MTLRCTMKPSIHVIVTRSAFFLLTTNEMDLRYVSSGTGDVLVFVDFKGENVGSHC